MTYNGLGRFVLSLTFSHIPNVPQAGGEKSIPVPTQMLLKPHSICARKDTTDESALDAWLVKFLPVHLFSSWLCDAFEELTTLFPEPPSLL